MVWKTLLDGALHKMQASLSSMPDEPLQYKLWADDEAIPINEHLSKTIRLEFLGDIHCQGCGTLTPKSYGQGFCYPCFTRLAQCDMCILSPERCHYEQGTCREPEWGQTFCMTEHIVYIANSSGLKVGITRASQIPTRWIDQGAKQAVPIYRVATRQQSGLMEVALKQQLADKTNWRALLKGEAETIDLLSVRNDILASHYKTLAGLQARFGIQLIQPIEGGSVFEAKYPVLQYPSKINSHNLDKNPVMEGRLLGIKGQYLILESAVINIRKYTAYQIRYSIKN